MSTTQDFRHHAKFDPPFHAFSAALLLLNVIAVTIHLVREPSWWNGWLLVLSLGVWVPLLRIRIYPLRVQDRLIRLEERLRLQALAPPDFQPEILRLTEDQLIGLRFASDGELVALAREALAQNLTRKQIKQRIQTWRPDHFRI